MADSVERLSYELTIGALTEQERALTSLRSCAGTVLGAASIAGSFLGARIGGRVLAAPGVLAMVAFTLCFGSAIWVLLPRDLGLSFGGEQLLADGEDDRATSIEDGYRAASRWIEPQLELNRRMIAWLADWLTISCVMLAVEVVLWTISLTG
jgi:hypothetical protein